MDWSMVVSNISIDLNETNISIVQTIESLVVGGTGLSEILCLILDKMIWIWICKEQSRS